MPVIPTPDKPASSVQKTNVKKKPSQKNMKKPAAAFDMPASLNNADMAASLNNAGWPPKLGDVRYITRQSSNVGEESGATWQLANSTETWVCTSLPDKKQVQFARGSQSLHSESAGRPREERQRP